MSGLLRFRQPHSVIQIGRLPGIASAHLMYDSSCDALLSHEPAFQPYQCSAMKSTRKFIAVAWFMKSVNHAWPGASAEVAGLPTRMPALAVSAGHMPITSATIRFA